MKVKNRKNLIACEKEEEKIVTFCSKKIVPFTSPVKTQTALVIIL